MASTSEGERAVKTFNHAKTEPSVHHASAKVRLSDVRFKVKSKVAIKASEMPVEMVRHAVELADSVIRQDRDEAEIAQHIKATFDNNYSSPWHCVVGRRFSSMVSHTPGYFLYFFIGKVAIVLFKCKD